MASLPIDGDELARIAIDFSPSGMLAVDGRGTLLLVNREIERLFGYSRSELIGRSMEILVPERFRGAHPGHRSSFLADPHARPMGAGRELFGLRRDGTEFPVEIGLQPLMVENTLCVFATVVDITARRTLEENLHRAQKLEAVGVLAGGIAHDFNNILLGIIGHTELALREIGGVGQAREDLDRVISAADRGRQLVQRILAFSRKSEVVRAPLRLETTVNEVLQLLRASLPRTIEIRPRLDPVTPSVVTDETQVHQILMNLATNAGHAMPNGGTITVALEPFVSTAEFAKANPAARTGSFARLTVSDTGVGMAQEVLDHVFEPFYTTKPVGEGTGLGLSVIHGIVRSHGGAVEIESAPGKGTSVRIYLPAAPADVEPAGATPPVAEPRRPRVMLVEDEQILGEMQRRQLRHLGYEVTLHTSSIEALEDFRTRPGDFELLITDDTMPRMTGSTLTREVLGIRPDLPVLMVSGAGNDAEKLRQIGVRKVLRKPHMAHELEQAILEVLENQ